MNTTDLGQTISGCRKERAMTQEQLAQALGITAQAVSKWETGQSYPDIQFLPLLADLFEVSLDELLGREYRRPMEEAGEDAPEPQIIYHELPWKDDRKSLHVVLFAGHKLVGSSPFHGRRKEKQQVEFCYEGPAIHIQSDFSVVCHERVTIAGNITAGDDVHCGNVGGNVQAGDSVHCRDVQGDVTAHDSVRCGNVTGDVKASDSVTCGDVGGSVQASDSVSCGNIKGDVRAGDSIRCAAIYGGASASGGVHIDQ